ncbi:MAG: Crp/Fnr family transcriptional regulator [Pyrinomonadaceae bacterium]
MTNRLLARLPRAEYERLQSSLELVRLPRHRILCEAGDPARHAYFLNNGMVSLLAVTEAGQTVEIGTVGCEGFVGLPIVLKVGCSPFRVMVQTQSEALRVAAVPLLGEFDRCGKLHELLLRYGHVQHTQIVQATVCNPFHTVSQRLCRRLLVTKDCLGYESFDLTQEYIALMLATHRNRISIAAAELQRKGFIRYDRRGRIRILDRKGLEGGACECYRIVKECLQNSFES